MLQLNTQIILNYSNLGPYIFFRHLKVDYDSANWHVVTEKKKQE